MADGRYSTPIVRYYIDTRSLVPRSDGNKKAPKPPLPLLSTLPQETQTAILRFYRVEDNFMSLASALLKFTFIHRMAKVPWSDIQISKTPKPHGRPFWDPPSLWSGDGFGGLEFNVSHQAGLIIIAGCRTPNRPEQSLNISLNNTSITPDPAQQQAQQIRIGVDVACTREERRTPNLPTQAKLEEFVDTFTEMFSAREIRDMKERPVPPPVYAAHMATLNPTARILEAKARRFFTYWALKEAYIKMVGEGLLADWLRQLEFMNVVSPDPDEKLTADEISLKTIFKGKDISSSVDVELEGFEETFLFTMISRGIAEQGRDLSRWERLDIENDIRPCAEGQCSCLS